MNDNDKRLDLIAHVVQLDENETRNLVIQRLEDGDDPLAIVEDCQMGLQQVGERYEKKEYFLAGLIVAGEIFRDVMELTQPYIEEKLSPEKTTGRVLLGTVQGDIHDIGKNIVSLLLNCYGFTVDDIGVDIPPTDFLLHASQNKPDIIGLSATLSSSFSTMQETVHLFKNTANRVLSSTPIIIGGYWINEEICHKAGADYWATEAMAGVRFCQKIMTEKSSQ
jgi:methanogenic corrinoid protein MtbC1